MRISDWSSDVCSSDLPKRCRGDHHRGRPLPPLPAEDHPRADRRRACDGGELMALLIKKENRPDGTIVIQIGKSRTVLQNDSEARAFIAGYNEIGRARVCTQVTNEPIVSRLLLVQKKHKCKILIK